MRQLIFLPVFLFCCLLANAQDYYLTSADECFEKGDYECAKWFYTLFQNQDGKDVNEQIQKAYECFRALIVADEYFLDKEYKRAKERYKIVMEKNPKDLYAKKQYDFCEKQLRREDDVDVDDDDDLIEMAEPDENSLSEKEHAGFSNYTETSNNLNIAMVAVQGGTFTMGCTSEQVNCWDDELPTHRVTLNDFYIGKYEVTQAQWQAVMGTNPSVFAGDNRPVESVCWNEVQDFITKLNSMTGKQYRLPTEAEWEFAARGGIKSKGYKYSGSNVVGRVAWYHGNSWLKTHNVGSKAPNELGIYDMSGNVYEWCSDWFSQYDSSTQDNPQESSSGYARVFRGGGWYGDAKYARVSYRFYFYPSHWFSYLGFRLACSLD